jgi:endonuclease III
MAQDTEALNKKEARKCAEALTQAAIDKYGKLETRKVRPPVDQLILSIFYRHTSVRRATRALRELKRGFVDWNEVRISGLEETVSHLSSADWAWESAREIKEFLDGLFERRNQVRLDFFYDDEMGIPDVRRFLRKLPHVDREMANEVLMLSLEKPVFPCSEPIARVCHRLGLLEDDRPTARNQQRLTRLFNEDFFPVLHRYLCDFAGRHCLPDVPDCKGCPMEEHCNSAK